MKNKKFAILWWATVLILLGLFGLCGMFYIGNRPYLTDPPQNSLNITLNRNIQDEIDTSDLDSLYTLAREIVDEWAPDAYLYRISLTTPCADLSTPTSIRFAFLKTNYLDIYTKQWNAFVDMDLEKNEIQFWVDKEERDPPPPLQKRLDLSSLKIGLPEARDFANQVQNVSNECNKVDMFFHNYVWDISYVDDPTFLVSERYPGVKINALTGEVQWKSGRK
jgi:hypothetical protein